jgi:hypothetical protein
MRSILSLIVGLTAVIALNLATPAYAQSSQGAQSATSDTGAAKQQRARKAARRQRARDNAAGSYGQAQSGSSGSVNSTTQQSGQCYIPTDVNNLGYWGPCTAQGAHQMK